MKRTVLTEIKPQKKQPTLQLKKAPADHKFNMAPATTPPSPRTRRTDAEDNRMLVDVIVCFWLQFLGLIMCLAASGP